MVCKRLLICAVAALLMASPAWATITVSIEPASQSVDILAPSVSVNIVADIPEADAIVQWGIDLSYNGSILDLAGGDWFSAVAINETLFDTATAPDGDALSALVPVASAPLWGDDLLLATVTFTPAGVGTSPLTLSDSHALGDNTEGFALNPPPVGAFGEVTYVGGEITVTPEPCSMALLALGGLALLRRR